MRRVLTSVLWGLSCLSTMVGAVTQKDIKTAEFLGRLYEPEVVTHSLALVVIGGSEGHLYQAEEVGPQLAAKGYVVLAVDYHDGYDPGRKLDLVPIEMFTHAVSWLKSSPSHPSQVAVMGDSRGSEAALLTGMYDADVAAVLAFVPSSVLWGATDNSAMKHNAAWSWQNKALACGNCDGAGTSWDKMLDDFPETAAARIAVENIHGPVFLAGSESDAVWPSSRMALEVASRLARKKFAYPVTLLLFPAASHQLWGTGPKNPVQDYSFQGKTFTSDSGGTKDGTEQARNRTWDAMLTFLAAVDKGK